MYFCYTIELFDYGSVDIRNRPTLIASKTLKGKGNKLKMSASEMLCFVKNLGLIIGDLIPLDSEISGFNLKTQFSLKI
ncbi:Ribosomal protein [Aphis craccivora]|uniref:Ribosomal protein n=1 Tax=Aphis craccivora TaxID=307492 RepID=A0A6G0Y496_APHCR|nr:Ribosomal protein [Aphis craccivora]